MARTSGSSDSAREDPSRGRPFPILRIAIDLGGENSVCGFTRNEWLFVEGPWIGSPLMTAGVSHFRYDPIRIRSLSGAVGAMKITTRFYLRPFKSENFNFQGSISHVLEKQEASVTNFP